jgi:prolyl oligopeptidase
LNAEARAVLRGARGFQKLLDCLEAHIEACKCAVPFAAGASWLRVERDPLAATAIVYLADSPGAKGRAILDARELVAGPNATIDWMTPSPDLRWIAVGASARGDEQTALHFVELETGRVARRAIPHVAGAAAVWPVGSAGVYCLAGPGDEHRTLHKDLVYVEPGERPRIVAVPDRHAASRRTLQLSNDGRYVGIVGTPVAPRLLCVLDRASGEWLDGPGVRNGETFSGLFLDGRYVAVTTVGAARGRLVDVPIERLSGRCSWRELVPEGTDVLRAVARAGDHLVLCSFLDGAARLRLVSADGDALQEVPLPQTGLVSADPRARGQYGTVPTVHGDPAGVTFSFSTVARSPVLMRFELKTGRTRALGKPAIVLDGIRVDSASCPSSDGWRVRYDHVSQGDPSSEPRPTLLVAYGGWNAMSTARGYLGLLAPFVQAGGSLVFAHLRGDATFGGQAWHAGRRDRKQLTFDDLFSVAEALLAGGVTDRAHLGIFGVSNGGLLVGAAITQRPELFAVAVALVPLLDMGRFVRERFGEYISWEYGDPRLPAEAAWLRAYSPYHNVRPGQRYPATLIVCGGSDARVHPWHGRKMIAALRSATSEGEPVHLRVHDDHGHLTLFDLAPPSITAEWLGFLMERLGVRLPDAADVTAQSEDPPFDRLPAAADG